MSWQSLYEFHGYVRAGKDMGEREQHFFDSVTSDMSDGTAELALQYLSDYLSRYYGQKDIYNPWSIINFLEEKEYKPYWANSSSNSLAGQLIQQGNTQTKTIMEELL